MRKNNKSVFIVLGLFILAPGVAQATNGLFVIGNGNKSRAMGGVGIAHPLDSLSGAANPATIAGMEDRFDIGMDLFRADVHSELGSVGADSEAAVNGIGLKKTFFFPAMAITYRWNEDITLGFSMGPAGGGGTKFETNFFEAANTGDPNAPSVSSKLGVDLAVMEMNPTIAYQFNKMHSVGVSMVMGVARFEANGLELFSTFTPSNTPDNLTDQGKQWVGGAGMRIGWLGDFGRYKLGAAYTSKIFMKDFDKYSELFAEAGSFDIPANLGLGVSYNVTRDLVVAMDVTHTFYEDTAAISNKGPNLAGDPKGPTDGGRLELGTVNGMGFGWDNMTVYKLGIEFKHDEKVTMRAGYNYGESPIKSEREIIFNLLAPATTEHHLTLGGTYLLNSTMEINVSYIHAFENQQSGPTYISDDGSNLGSLSMSQDSLGGSFSMKY